MNWSSVPLVRLSAFQHFSVLAFQLFRCMDLANYTTKDFDRGARRLKEVLWTITKALFFMPSWPWPSRLRASLLRLFGAQVGRGLVIRSRVNITFPWRLCVADHVWIGEETVILSLEPSPLNRTYAFRSAHSSAPARITFTDMISNYKPSLLPSARKVGLPPRHLSAQASRSAPAA